MDREREYFVMKLLESRESVESILKLQPSKVVKDAQKSEEVRKRGNSLFTKKSHNSGEHEEILSLYNESIALAPEKSEELALAYGNRSAFLSHICRHEDCISDIDKALKISSSDVLKVKLLCRKVKCMLQLGQHVGRDEFQEIELLLDKIPENAIKTSLKNMALEIKSLPRRAIKNDIVDPPINNHIDCKKDILKSIRFEYNEKCGRHLIATRDIKPGEIVFVENLYTSCLNLHKMYTNCQHCHTTCWSGIPCENCNWAMFCSEKCKLEANQNYHQVECPVITFLEDIYSHIVIKQKIITCIHLLLMALKEAGSIGKLKSDLDAVDRMGTSYPNYMMVNGVDNKFTTLYSLPIKMRDDWLLCFKNNLFLSNSILVVTYLTKYTQLFGGGFDPHNFEDLTANPDFTFLGSLFIRLQEIQKYYVNSILCTAIPESFEDNVMANNDDDDIDSATAYGFGVVANFIKHSCIPNTNILFTKDEEIVIYAIHPIKKNSQIFNSYFGPTEMTKLERQSYLKENYQCNCDCRACVEDWNLNAPTDYLSVESGLEIAGRIDEIGDLLISKKSISKKELKKYTEEVSDLIVQVSSRFPPASSLSRYLESILKAAFQRMYDLDKNIFKSC